MDQPQPKGRGAVVPKVSPLTQAWPRAYCDSQQSELENWRAYFLTRIEVHAPMVLLDLRSVVTLYTVAFNDCFFDELPTPHNDESVRALHREMVVSWLTGPHGDVSKIQREMLAVRCPPSATPGRTDYSEGLRSALLAWGDAFAIRADWILVAALDTLYAWSRARQSPDEWRVRFAGPNSASVDLSIPILQYDGFDLDEYDKYLRDLFKREKERLMADASAKAALMRPARRFSKAARVDGLVLRLCCNLDPASIALRIPGYQKHDSGIRKDLAELAAYLGLAIPVGRRRKTRKISTSPHR